MRADLGVDERDGPREKLFLVRVQELDVALFQEPDGIRDAVGQPQCPAQCVNVWHKGTAHMICERAPVRVLDCVVRARAGGKPFGAVPANFMQDSMDTTPFNDLPAEQRRGV